MILSDHGKIIIGVLVYVFHLPRNSYHLAILVKLRGNRGITNILWLMIDFAKRLVAF